MNQFSVKNEAVMSAFSEFDQNGLPADYGDPVRYFVEHPETKELYPQKAIYGIARNLSQRDCPSATNTRKAIEAAGFVIVDSKDELAVSPKFYDGKGDLEGKVDQVTINRHERSKKNRDACIAFYRQKNDGHLRCESCKFDFELTYGEVGTNFIHIHHKAPLGNLREEHLVDPIKDLIPLCPNCHAMSHRGIKKGEKTRSAKELRKIRLD